MRILSRGFLASYLILFAAILSASILAISVIEVMLHFDDISPGAAGLAAVGRWLAVRIPSYYLRDLIPVTSFSAAFLCIALPARRRELTACMAGGISPLRIAAPVWIAAAALSAVTLVVDETLVLRASREWNRHEAAGDGLLRRGPFWYHTEDGVYNVGGAEPETRSLRDVDFYQLSPEGRLLRRVRAEHARVGDDGGWHLEDAYVVRLDPDHVATPPQLEPVAALRLGDHTGAATAPDEARSLSLPALGDRIAQLEDAGRPAVRERARLHARLVDPAAVLLFALLAVPLGLAVDATGSVSIQALRGGIALAGYYSARAVASLLALAGVSWATGLPWLLVALCGLAGILLLARRLRAV